MNSKIILALVLICGIYFFSKQTDDKKGVAPVIAAPYHIIVAIDASGTTQGSGWPMPEKTWYESQIEFLEQNGGGVLELFNMANSVPTSIKLRIEPIKTKPDIYSGEQEIKKVETLNKSILQRNEISKSLFLKQLDSKVINYQPLKGQDYTYVLQNCRSIQQCLQMPQYSGHNQYVLLYSDLLDDTPKSKETPIDKDFLSQIGSLSNLSICNHSTNSNYEDVGATIIPDYNDFLELIKNSVTN